MAKGLVNESSLNSIAEAINVLNGTEGTYMPSEMGEAIIDAIPTETASGNPIHITDAANYPAESVVTTLEPVQDLHGYDKPWPAGGGKNLLPMTVADIKALNTSGSWSGNVYTKDGITFELLTDSALNVTGIKVNGTFTAVSEIVFYICNSVPFIANEYIFGCASANLNDDFRLRFNANGFFAVKTSEITRQLTEETACSAMIVVNAGYTVNNITINPMIRLASVTDPTFEPYSNICPISGHTGGELTRTGKNLANSFLSSYAPSISTGKLVPYQCWCTDFIQIDNTKAYIVSKILEDSVGYVLFYSETKEYLGYINFSASGTSINTYSLYSSAKYIKLRTDGTSDANIQLELGSTATTYKPYQGEPHSITFPQAQSPVYGGEVDWVNGVLRVTKVKQKLQNMSTDQSKTGFIRVNQQLLSAKVPQTSQTLLSNVLISDYVGIIGFIGNPSKPYSFWYDKRAVYVALSTDDFATASDWNTYLNSNDVYIIYELATPLETPLTPEVITLLRGESNVWTDAGTSEIEYKVDLQSYIQKLINEASTNASALSVSPLSLGRNAALTSTDGEDADEIEEVDEPVLYDEVKVSDDVASEGEAEEEPTVKEPDTLEKEDGDTV